MNSLKYGLPSRWACSSVLRVVWLPVGGFGCHKHRRTWHEKLFTQFMQVRFLNLIFLLGGSRGPPVVSSW
jgi:hypothetical protein